MLIFILFMQVYIVSGGRDRSGNVWASTETLVKNGGSAWQMVANLPSARQGVRGVGLDHGRFMITGQWSSACKICRIKMNILTRDSDTWQVEERWSHGIM